MSANSLATAPIAPPFRTSSHYASSHPRCSDWMQVTEFRDALARGPGWTEEQLKERAKLQQQVGTMKIAPG